MKSLGILGGTFDPVHLAHVQLAKEALTALSLAQVLWIPAGNPPHRRQPFALPAQRCAMVKLAIDCDKRFLLDDSEVLSAAPSYTVTTLQRLRPKHGLHPLVLLLGADAFLGLDQWHLWREIFSLAHIAVATRPGYVLDVHGMTPELRGEYLARKCEDVSLLHQHPAGSIVTFEITPLDISASAIRAQLAGQPAVTQKVQDLLPKTVLDYIAANHLYSSGTPN